MGAPGKPLKVLLVEDLEDDRFFFQHALEHSNLNAELFIAKDGLEAVEFLKSESKVPSRPRFPDVVFLDLKMPEFDGFDVLRWMNRESLLNQTKVYVLSGSDEPRDIQLAKELGAVSYFVKHIKAPALNALLAPQISEMQQKKLKT